MLNPVDASVLIYSSNLSFAGTLRTGLRGMGVRQTAMALDESQVIAGFSAIDPNVMMIYADEGPADRGLEMLRFIRRSPASPKRQIPVVVVSQSRDIKAISAVINQGANEYVLFPASGDQLLKKIISARTSTRPFIDGPDYFGPCRRRRADPAWNGPERRSTMAKAVAESK